MERHDPGDLENISAYAKLEFDQFSFFIQTLTLIVGRKARREDNVDVHLGVSKSISRVHAKIFYQFDAMTWEIEVLGKNGAFINERYVQAGKKSALRSTDKLLIGDAHFVFLLPDGATAPLDPSQANHAATNKRVTNVPSTPRPFVPSKVIPLTRNETNGIIPATPLAPHHLMANPLAAQSKVVTNTVSTPITNLAGTIATTDAQTKSGISSGRAYLTTPQNQADYSSTSTISQHKTARLDASAQLAGTGLSADNLLSNIKVENVQNKADPFWSHKIPTNSVERPVVSDQEKIESLEVQAKTEEERRLQEEEAAAQHAAQLLHQERLARQAREEEEGLILPPAETDPAVIAALQKPSASYATMIYNAIASHEKKKMTLAQIYSWICINHPYYRYVQNGWQNSIRHNLSLNKAFMKVPRTDDEPGKGSFWAVDPESEMLFEGGVYKKKPPRPMPSVPLSRGAPVVMKDGKLALNPNFFLGGIQGKAEEVLQMLQAAVQKQLGYGNEPEQASQIARILALALATQLRQAAVANNTPRHPQAQIVNRPVSVTMPPSLPRYPATPAPSAYRAPVVQSLPRTSQANGTLGLSASGTSPGTVRLPINTTLANTVPKHPYAGSPYAINANSSVPAIAGSKVPQVNSISSPSQSKLQSVASGVSHVAVKPITNPVYYKPYLVANASAPTVKSGVPNTTTAKLTPGIAQNYDTVLPIRADQAVKSMSSVNTTLTKIHPVRSSADPVEDSSALNLGEKSAAVLQSPVVHPSSKIPQTSTQSSIQAGQPEIAGASTRSSATTPATVQVVTPYACSQPANASTAVPTLATKSVEGLPAGVGVTTALMNSPDITKEVPVVSSVSKPSIPATINVEHTDPGPTNKVTKDQSGARPEKSSPDISVPITRTDSPSTTVAKDDVVRVQNDPATRMSDVSVLRSTSDSMASASSENPASSFTASGNNKRSVPADAETSANKVQKADSTHPAGGDVKQVVKVDG